ncbi:MAG: Zn-ribbon-containing protein [Parcubacteria group bacterium GW2011_GWA2_38_13]|nr:MAG: Zn-ribbon-containing protein [Parcubacteria group bacterium GW2011_GWA2_38_13]
MPLTPLNNLLGNSLKKAGIQNQVSSAIVLEQFEKITQEFFGMEGAKHVKPLYIKDKILNVACLSSVFAQELKFREKEILEKLNEGKNIQVVERVRYLI